MEPEEPQSFIDLVNKKLESLPEQLHSISTGNQIQIIDTPHIWGLPMNEKGVAEQAKASVEALAYSVYEMIAGAERQIDIVSLNPADGVFLLAIKRGLKVLAKAKRTVTVRFLFGWVPTRDTVSAFRLNLAQFCKAEQIATDSIKIRIGQYYSYKAMFWNHAKIVAVDGKVALVGGHNLWDSAYGKYPPVHDVSVLVFGDAAAGAHGYVDFLWKNAGYYLVTWSINDHHQVSALESPGQWDYTSMDMPIMLEDTSVIRGPSKLTLLDDSTELPKGTEARKKWPPVKAGRVMSLGRCGGLKSGALNASDVAKKEIIFSARKSLKFCQQDLLFRGAKGEGAHQVCHWIAEALLRNTVLVVQIVVSPINASGAGDQYSWGSGATGTHQLLCALIRKKSDSGAQARQAIERLHVAPFCFTNVVFQAEGDDYSWPDVPKSIWAGRFGLYLPAPSRQTYPPAPGNHAKVFIVDDRAFYVGSDNLYPHNLAEFGYLIEGDPVKVLLDTYWSQVWEYSKAHCIVETQPSKL